MRGQKFQNVQYDPLQLSTKSISSKDHVVSLLTRVFVTINFEMLEKATSASDYQWKIILWT